MSVKTHVLTVFIHVDSTSSRVDRARNHKSAVGVNKLCAHNLPHVHAILPLQKPAISSAFCEFLLHSLLPQISCPEYVSNLSLLLSLVKEKKKCKIIKKSFDDSYYALQCTAYFVFVCLTLVYAQKGIMENFVVLVSIIIKSMMHGVVLFGGCPAYVRIFSLPTLLFPLCIMHKKRQKF